MHLSILLGKDFLKKDLSSKGCLSVILPHGVASIDQFEYFGNLT